MTTQFFHKWIIAVGLSLTLFACAGKPQKFSTPHNQYELARVDKLSELQKSELYETIIAADLAAFQKDHLTAMSFYLQAADLSWNKALIIKAIEQAELAKDPLGLEQAATIWLSFSPKDPEALKVLIKSQITTNQPKRAIEALDQLLSLQKNHSEKFQILVEETFEYNPTLTYGILNQLLEIPSHKPAVIVASAKLIMELTEGGGQDNKALNSAYDNIETVLTIAPDFYEAIKLKSQLLYRFRQVQKAREFLLQKYFDYPDSKPITHILGQYLYDTQDYASLLKIFTPWIEDHPKDNPAILFVAAGNFHQQRYELSLKYFNLLYQRKFKPDLAAFYCGESAIQLKQFISADKCYQRVLQGQYLVSAKIKRARILIEQERHQAALDLLGNTQTETDEDKIKITLEEIRLLNLHFPKAQARQKLNQALKQFPGEYRLILSKIDIFQLSNKPKELIKVLKEAQDSILSDDKLNRFNLLAAELLNKQSYYELAIKWLDDAIEQTENHKELKYTRSLFRENLGQYSQMIQEFKALLKEYPDDLNIKNALGYTLADRNQELEYAQSLIDSAYQQFPDNAAIIDSKGWLAYRMGKLDAAEEYLKRAFKLYPAAEVAAHLGEVLWVKKQYEAAKSVWRSGLQLDKNNKTLKMTLERFKLELEP